MPYELFSLARKHTVSNTGTVYLRLRNRDDDDCESEVIISPSELPALLVLIAKAISTDQQHEFAADTE